jgi:hypothetical protein
MKKLIIISVLLGPVLAGILYTRHKFYDSTYLPDNEKSEVETLADKNEINKIRHSEP